MKKIKEFKRKVIGAKPKEYLVLFLLLAVTAVVGGILMAISDRSLRVIVNPFFIFAVSYLAFKIVYYFKEGKKLCE